MPSVGVEIENQPKSVSQFLSGAVLVNNSTTLTDTGMEWTVQAGKQYKVYGFLKHESSEAADMKIRFTPSSGTLSKGGLVIFSRDTGSTEKSQFQSDLSLSLFINGVGGNGYGAVLTGSFYADTDTTVKLQFAQQTADVSDTRLYGGTWVTLEELG